MSQLAPQPMYSGTKPIRDPSYMRFIRRLPCLVCTKTWWVESCHTGSHGIGQKSSDWDCIPLCRTCHEKYDAAPAKFAERHKLDIPALIEVFNSFYQTKLGGNAA